VPDPAVLAGKGPDPRPFWPGNDQIPASWSGSGRHSPSPLSFANRKRGEAERERERVFISKKKKKNLMRKFHVRLYKNGCKSLGVSIAFSKLRILF
jgi:hypothetical protein